MPPIFAFSEIIDMVIMVVITGFIFSGYVRRPKILPGQAYDPLKPNFMQKGLLNLNMQDFLTSCLIIGVPIILHELGHKFVAMHFGMHATFHAFYMMLGIGLVLKLLGSPFLIMAPAYVSYIASPTASPITFSAIAFAGPAVHLIFFLAATIILSIKKKLKENTYYLLEMTKQVNLLLFIFNMIPIRPFDGYTVFQGLIATLF